MRACSSSSAPSNGISWNPITNGLAGDLVFGGSPGHSDPSGNDAALSVPALSVLVTSDHAPDPRSQCEKPAHDEDGRDPPHDVEDEDQRALAALSGDHGAEARNE